MLVSPNSSMYTLSQDPISCGVGGVILGSGVAPTALQQRRKSNLDMRRMAMILYLLRKCSHFQMIVYIYTPRESQESMFSGFLYYVYSFFVSSLTLNKLKLLNYKLPPC